MVARDSRKPGADDQVPSAARNHPHIVWFKPTVWSRESTTTSRRKRVGPSGRVVLKQVRVKLDFHEVSVKPGEMETDHIPASLLRIIAVFAPSQ